SDVALLRIAWQGAMLAATGLSIVEMVVAPHFAHLHAQSDQNRMTRLLALSARSALMIAVPVLILYAVLGPFILSTLFGASFEGAYAALLILAAGRVAASLAGPVNTVLIMIGR